MPAFPRNLKEIKDRLEKDRRPKPRVTGDELTEDLGPKFKQANEEEVLHAHHEDEEPVKNGRFKSKAQKEFQAKDPKTQKDLLDGLDALDEIEKWIVGETSRLLDKINHALAEFNAADSTGESAALTKYNAAINKFEEFVAKLNKPDKDPDGNFGATINAAIVEPIQTGGYYTSARVIIEWRGGTHSGSSLIHVP